MLVSEIDRKELVYWYVMLHKTLNAPYSTEIDDDVVAASYLKYHISDHGSFKIVTPLFKLVEQIDDKWKILSSMN